MILIAYLWVIAILAIYITVLRKIENYKPTVQVHGDLERRVLMLYFCVLCTTASGKQRERVQR